MINDIDQSILKCWSITEDIELLRKMMTDKEQKMSDDDVDNFLLGLVSVYNAKFQDLHDTFEKYVKERANPIPTNKTEQLIALPNFPEYYIDVVNKTLHSTKSGILRPLTPQAQTKYNNGRRYTVYKKGLAYSISDVKIQEAINNYFKAAQYVT